MGLRGTQRAALWLCTTLKEKYGVFSWKHLTIYYFGKVPSYAQTYIQGFLTLASSLQNITPSAVTPVGLDS